jgi:hypothetical protein
MPIKIKKKKDKKQKQKQKQVVNQRVVVNLADTKPRRRVARRRPQSSNIPQSDASLRQIVTQYVPIQSGSSVPNIVKYYNNIMTPKTEPIKDIQAVRQQQQEDYTDAIRQSAKEEEAGIINPLVAEQDDMDVMNRAIIQQAEEYNKKKKLSRERRKEIKELLKNKNEKLIIMEDETPYISVNEFIGARRGRPSGSKNKPKEVLEQERLKKKAQRDARERRREEILRQSGYITENPQTDVGEDFTGALKKIQDGDY